MEEDATLVTREQYIEMLIDASEMESGFTSGANGISRSGVNRDMMKRGSVNALKWRRSLEVSTVN